MRVDGRTIVEDRADQPAAHAVVDSRLRRGPARRGRRGRRRTDDSAKRRTLLDRAVASFAAGRVAQSAAEFDELARLVPEQAPYLWQRGIAQYYAGRFRECRAQFESHRTVNADDVENAAWHFLCVARAESVASARAALLPVGPDPRVPMREIYQMFRGDLSPEQVMAAAGTRPDGQFYAHLYVALYAEAAGDRAAHARAFEVGRRQPLRERWRLHAHGGSRPPGAARRDPIEDRAITASSACCHPAASACGHPSRGQ